MTYRSRTHSLSYSLTSSRTRTAPLSSQHPGRTMITYRSLGAWRNIRPLPHLELRFSSRAFPCSRKPCSRHGKRCDGCPSGRPCHWERYSCVSASGVQRACIWHAGTSYRVPACRTVSRRCPQPEVRLGGSTTGRRRRSHHTNVLVAGISPSETKSPEA